MTRSCSLAEILLQHSHLNSQHLEAVLVPAGELLIAEVGVGDET